MNAKFFRRLFFLLCIFIISQNVDAQYKFYVSMSFNYNCHGNRECEELVRMTNGMIQNAISGIPISFNTKNECEAARNITVNSLNEAKSLASQYASRYGVKFNFTVTPCSGFGGGNFVFLGPNRGSSFYSPSVADEIKNWSEDNERLQAALNPEWERSEQMAVETSDYSFDEERKNLREGFVIDTDKPFRSLNINANVGINTRFADYYSPINTFSHNIISPKVIPANEQLVDSFLSRVNEDSAPSLIDDKYIDWIKDQFEKVSDCNRDIDAILNTSLRTEEENAILGNYQEFQKRLLDKAISSIDKIILSIRKSKEKKETDMAILALDCYDKNLSEEGKNNSQNYLFLTDYERVDVNSPNISNSIKGLAEKIANLNGKNNETGFNAVLYYNKITDEYTIAFEGSSMPEIELKHTYDPTALVPSVKYDINKNEFVVRAYNMEVVRISQDSWNDWLKNNALQAIGIAGSQFKAARQLGEYINNQFGVDDNNIKINFTGHSLGGALASIAGLITGKPTYTYNAEGVSDKILKEFELLEKKQNQEFEITAYHTSNDVLTLSQSIVQRLSEKVPFIDGEKNNYISESIGTKVNIGILNNPINIFGAHSMRPVADYFLGKIFGKNINLLSKYENSKKNMIREIDNIRMRTSKQVYIETE